MQGLVLEVQSGAHVAGTVSGERCVVKGGKVAIRDQCVWVLRATVRRWALALSMMSSLAVEASGGF